MLEHRSEHGRPDSRKLNSQHSLNQQWKAPCAQDRLVAFKYLAFTLDLHVRQCRRIKKAFKVRNQLVAVLALYHWF